MDCDDDLEPTAWPEQPVALRNLDKSLRCPICHDFFITPKTLLCGHTFCHSCILSNLEFQMQNRMHGKPGCPNCRAEADSRDLRMNHTLAHIVKCFSESRPHLLRCARGAAGEARATPASPGKQVPKTPRPDGSLRGRKRRAAHPPAGSASRSAGEANGGGAPSTSSSSGGGGSAGDSDFSPEQQAPRRAPGWRRRRGRGPPPPGPSPKRASPPEGKVECPICGGFFPAGEGAQRHVDLCLVRGGAAASSEGRHSNGSAAGEPLRKLPKLAFSLLKGNQLADTIRRWGVPTTPDGRPGASQKAPRETLERRYTDVRREVERALDSGERASMEEIVRKVLSKERQLSSANRPRAFQIRQHGAPREPAGARPEGSSHQALIDSVRERMRARENAHGPAKAAAEGSDAQASSGAGAGAASGSAGGECLVIDGSDVEVVADSQGEEEEEEEAPPAAAEADGDGPQ